MRRDSIIQLIATLGLIVSMAFSWTLMPRINASASEAQLKYTDEATEGAPLVVTVAQSVGVLRGLAVNFLWIRADKLKEDGKFFEAYSLANWITQLQPRFAKVWSFQAWNMAYNISVATNTKEERWKWVQSGARLLREKGIKYNPNDMMLYKELSWIFIHKIGGFTDDAHTYYKQQLADRWQGLLGAPPYEYEDRMAAIRKIAEATGNLEELLMMHPEVEPLLDALEAIDVDLDESFLRQLENINTFRNSFFAQKSGLNEQFDAISSVENLKDDVRVAIGNLILLKPIIDDEQYQDAWPLLVSHTRKRVLKDEYNMDAEYMLDCMQKHGPLDWRSPFAHSLYWAALGVPRGLSRRVTIDFDRINTDRLLFHSSQQLKFSGRVQYDFMTKEITWGPDLRFIPFYEDAFNLVYQREIDKVNDQERPAKTRDYVDGYRNFLIDSVREYYQWGQFEKAEEYYKKLRTDPQFFEMDKADRFTLDIKDFILQETKDRFTSPAVARNHIIGIMMSTFRFGLARGDMEAFQRNLAEARILYDFYNHEILVETLVTEGNRLGFPEWPEMLIIGYKYVMTDDTVSMAEKVAVWNINDQMVAELRLITYDQIVDQMRGSYAAKGPFPMPFDVAFPPPPGIEQYRERKRAATQNDNQGSGINFDRK